METNFPVASRAALAERVRSIAITGLATLQQHIPGPSSPPVRVGPA